ncbi:MAG: putative ABC transport system permease protein [Verrucomicrobiales bacterium]|jgi:putative ABC transport system permease protein
MFKLALQSLVHYWRLNLCVMLGVFLASAVLTGSLVVGDSVRATLAEQGMLRVGKIDAVLVGGDRFFTEGLVDRLRQNLASSPFKLTDDLEVTAAVITVGTARSDDGSQRANRVQIMGVEDAFWGLADTGEIAAPGEDFFAINEALARRFDFGLGDGLRIQMEKPGDVPRDAPLAGSVEGSSNTVQISGAVTHVISDLQLGRFSLQAEQEPALTVFVPLGVLQKELEQHGRANLILASVAESEGKDRFVAAIPDYIRSSWNLEDAALNFGKVGDGSHQLGSKRIFVSEATEAAVRKVVPARTTGVLTYLVNELRFGDVVVPYSMGTAVEGDVFGELGPDEAVITEWLADPANGGLKVGDEFEMEFLRVADGRQMVPSARKFSVAQIVPMDDPRVSKSWAPDFPGVSDSENYRELDPGFTLNKELIRDQDEQYWEDYNVTPKVFISLVAAQQDGMWANRFGRVTGLRIADEGMIREVFEEELKKHLDLFDLGPHVRFPVMEARAAVKQSMDFGGLFAALSFFLIVAALVLVALLFVFGLEQRSAQVGTLLATGFEQRAVRKLLMREGGMISFAGAVLGAIGGIVYTKAALWALGNVWQGAVAGLEFTYHAKWLSLAMGILIVHVMAKLALWIASRKIVKVPARVLLAGGGVSGLVDVQRKPATKLWSFWLAIGGAVGGVGLALFAQTLQGQALAGAFYGAGSLLLIAGIAALALLLRRWALRDSAALDLASLGRRNALRRRGRSLAVAGIMASGVFMVMAVNSFRIGFDDAGTGGFKWMGRSTLPVYENLNTKAGEDAHGLDPLPEGAEIVSLRVRQGAEASCLNLNRAQQPRLVGMNPKRLAERDAFVFTKKGSWSMLDDPADAEGTVPGIADMNSAMWAMGKKLGDIVTYPAADGELRVQLVAFLQGSVLQGNVIISEEAFKAAYPDAGGYQMFLIDLPDGEAGDDAKKDLGRQLQSRGLELVSAAGRLADYNRVQNTYISIFTVLGGLGVLLGTVGVALVIGRNVLERRGELALMGAQGFRRSQLARMVLSEHWFLLVAGILIGVVSSLVAVLPNLLTPSAGLPVGLIVGLTAAIMVAGLAFCWVATQLALRGNLMESLRAE